MIKSKISIIIYKIYPRIIEILDFIIALAPEPLSELDNFFRILAILGNLVEWTTTFLFIQFHGKKLQKRT